MYETYQAIIIGAKQVVENHKPEIEIDPDWEMARLEMYVKHLLEELPQN